MIPPYEKKIKQAAELRMMLSQQRWGPAKWVTGAIEDETPCEQANFEK